MKHISSLSFASFFMALTTSFSATADENTSFDILGDFSMTATAVSDYAFRGITQSGEGPAIQGSLDYSVALGQVNENDIGLYLGIWGSSVDFNDNDEASTEFDFYGGLTYEIEGISIDVGAIYYAYPGTSSNLNYDYWESQAALGYDFGVASAVVSINYSPKNFGDSGDAIYYKAAAEIPLPHNFTLYGHVGHQKIGDNITFGNPDYTDWAAGVGTTVEGIDLKIEYIDTNISSSRCVDGCDSRGVFTVSKSF